MPAGGGRPGGGAGRCGRRRISGEYLAGLWRQARASELVLECCIGYLLVVKSYFIGIRDGRPYQSTMTC